MRSRSALLLEKALAEADAAEHAEEDKADDGEFFHDGEDDDEDA